MFSDFFASSISTKDKKISLQDFPYLIAEIGINHDGKLSQALDFIEKAAECKVDAVKFQSYSIDSFISKSASDTKFLYDIFAAIELNYEQHQKLSEKAKSCGVDFFSTPLTLNWVKTLHQLNVPFFKVASGDVNNFQLLTEIVKTKTPIFHSTGAASFAEIERAAAFYRQMNYSDVIFFHCVSLYPTFLHQANIETIFKLRKELDTLVGFSDHTEGWQAAFAAVSAGAVAVEKHFTADSSLDGPDHKISSSPLQFKELREKINLAFQIRGEAKQEALEDEKKGDYFGKRSLYRMSNNSIMAMRPRQKDLPKDSDFFLYL